MTNEVQKVIRDGVRGAGHALCPSCGEEIILRPSATERAKKFGETPAYYIRLFTKHADCQIADNAAAVRELIRSKTNAG